MSDLELQQLFDNTFDCYTYYEDDSMEEVKEPAMTKATFVAEVFKLLRKQANDARTGDRQLTIPDVRLALSGFWTWYAELSIEELEWYNGKEVETYLATL